MKHIHRTAVFTLHSPTRHVCAALESVFTLYTHAYTTALHHFRMYPVQELHAMATYAHDQDGQPRTSVKRLVQALFARDTPAITAALTPLESSLRESLKVHVAETLLSYIELSLDPKQSPSYPSRLRKQDREKSRLEALEGLRALADDVEREGELTAQLARTKQPEAVSLSFVRIDVDRNCGLFYNPETKRFYARLSVISPRSRYAKPLTMAGRYIDVRSGVVYARYEDADPEHGVESFGRGKGAILVPLEMGAWHENPLRFIEQAFLPQRLGEQTALEPVSARLVKYKDAYQLHVSFRIPKPERVQTATLFGLDRGINCLAAGAIVSLDGKEVLETYQADGTELRTLLRQKEHLTALKQQKGKITKGDRQRARIADQHVHLCANQIVALAIKYRAQVVMEDLASFAAPHKREKGVRRSNFNKMLPRRQYQKLQDVVNSKLALVGLPPIRVVSASFTSQTCSQCGHISKENRSAEDRTQFRCAACNHVDHADVQAGINIARRLLWMTLRSQEKKRNVDEKDRTPWATFVTRYKQA